VLIDTPLLQAKIDEQLENLELYSPIPFDPTSKYVATIKKLLAYLTEHEGLNPQLLSQYKKSVFNPPIVFSQIKTHKDGFPIRLITSGKTAPNNVLAKLIAPMLKTLSEGKFTVKNSQSIMESLKDQIIPSGYTWASFDIKAMFPSLDQNLVLDIVAQELAVRPHILDSLGFDIRTFLVCLKTIFMTTYIRHGDKFYDQVNGTPMGSMISSYLCDIVLNRLDHLVTNHFPEILFYWRFVDDTLALMPLNLMQEVLSFLNAFHPSIQFTFELAKNSSINFLDLKLSTNSESNKVEFNHFRKPSQTTRVIPYHSEQDLKIKINCIKNEVHRVCAHTSAPLHLNFEFQYLIDKYLQNGYPLGIISKCIFQFIINQKKDKSISQTPSGPTPLPPPRIIVPFLPDVHKQLNKMQRSCNFQSVAVKGNTIGSLLKKKIVDNDLKGAKSTLKTNRNLLQSNIVYQVPCSSCPSKYCGTSKQLLKNRFSSHKSEIKNKVENNAFFQHLKKTTHYPDFTKFKILFREKQYFTRLNLETLSIYSLKNPINTIIPHSPHLHSWHKLLQENKLLYLFSP
jgi:hypothetical protein